MPRRPRIAPGEIIYHALNRANGRSRLYDQPGDYAAFERIMVAAMRRSPIRLPAYCLMPNHWHMVLWPKKNGEMTEFLHWLTLTHSQRLHAHRHTTGYLQIVMLGITAMAKVAAEVEQAGATCVPNAFYLGPGFLAVLHCLAAKEKESPLERMFADFGATPFSKTVPVVNGGVEVPESPGLGADPEDDLIARFRV